MFLDYLFFKKDQRAFLKNHAQGFLKKSRRR